MRKSASEGICDVIPIISWLSFRGSFWWDVMTFWPRHACINAFYRQIINGNRNILEKWKSSACQVTNLLIVWMARSMCWYSAVDQNHRQYLVHLRVITKQTWNHHIGSDRLSLLTEKIIPWQNHLIHFAQLFSHYLVQQWLKFVMLFDYDTLSYRNQVQQVSYLID